MNKEIQTVLTTRTILYVKITLLTDLQKDNN